MQGTKWPRYHFSVFNVIDKDVNSYPIEKLRIAVGDNIENLQII